MEGEEVEELVEFGEHFVANVCKVRIGRAAVRVRQQIRQEVSNTRLDETDG